MSRSGYCDDYDYDSQWRSIMWRGTVASAIRGRRGQAFLRELVAALDALPQRRLIAHDLIKPAPAFIPPEHAAPCVCAIGSVGLKRGFDMEKLDPYEYDQVAEKFGIAAPLVREIEYLNDERAYEDTPETRWSRMRDWAVSQLKDEAL